MGNCFDLTFVNEVR